MALRHISIPYYNIAAYYEHSSIYDYDYVTMTGLVCVVNQM